MLMAIVRAVPMSLDQIPVNDNVADNAKAERVRSLTHPHGPACRTDDEIVLDRYVVSARNRYGVVAGDTRWLIVVDVAVVVDHVPANRDEIALHTDPASVENLVPTGPSGVMKEIAVETRGTVLDRWSKRPGFLESRSPRSGCARRRSRRFARGRRSRAIRRCSRPKATRQAMTDTCSPSTADRAINDGGVERAYCRRCPASR